MSKPGVLIVDTLSGLLDQLHTEVCDTQFGGDWKKFNDFAAGHIVCAGKFRPMLAAYDACRAKGVAIILLAHVNERLKATATADMWQIEPKLPNREGQMVSKWADAVLYLGEDAMVDKDGRVKASSRVLKTAFGPPYACKNRWNLPADIDAGSSPKEAWANLTKAIAEARAKAKGDVAKKPPKMVIYGSAGAGKTTIAGQAPGAVFLNDPMDEGVLTNQAAGDVPEGVTILPSPKSFSEAVKLVLEVAKDA